MVLKRTPIASREEAKFVHIETPILFMLNIPSVFKQSIELSSKVITGAAKFGVLAGGACVVAYALKIEHFPQDLSAGDGLLFIMTAACFGFIYAFFVGGLISLGVVFSPVTKAILKIFLKCLSYFREREIAPKFPLAPFDWGAVIWALLALILIWALGRKDPWLYWTLPPFSIGLYIFYSLFLDISKQIQKIEILKNSSVLTQEKEDAEAFDKIEKYRLAQLRIIVFVLIAPLLVGGASGQLLDAAMRTAHVRIEKSTVYIREPYQHLLPESYKLNQVNNLKEYVAFGDLVILFKGFGKTTVIAYKENGESKKIEIPNDYIIVIE